MKWLLLPALIGMALLVAVARRQRLERHRYDERYVQQLHDWHHRDPQIAALPLPPVRRMQAQTADRVTRFKRRAGGER